MPQIPQYVSKESLNTQPNKQINVESFVESAGGNNMIKAGKQLESVGDKLIEIQKANDESNANIERLKFEDTYSKQIDANPDTATALKNIENDTRKNREETAKTIHDPMFRQEWLQKQELSDQVYIINQKAKISKRIVSEGVVNLYRDLELDKSNYRNAQDEEEKNLAVQSMHNKIYDPKRTALFKDEEEKYKLEEDTIKQAQDDLKDVESVRKSEEKEARLAEEAAVTANEKNYQQMKASGIDENGQPISKADLIIRLKNDPNLSERYRAISIASLKSSKAVGAKTVDSDFSKIMQGIRENVDTPKLMVDMDAMRTDGKLSKEDYNKLTAFLNKVSSANPDDLIARKHRDGIGKLFGWAENNMGGAQNKALETESRARMNRLYLDKLSEGIEPDEAALQTVREETLHIMSKAGQIPEEGLIVIDKNGIMKKIMPNGDIVLADTKPKKTK